ncbi:hypothetical protein [Streptomyces sp. NPDC003635]
MTTLALLPLPALRPLRDLTGRRVLPTAFFAALATASAAIGRHVALFDCDFPLADAVFHGPAQTVCHLPMTLLAAWALGKAPFTGTCWSGKVRQRLIACAGRLRALPTVWRAAPGRAGDASWSGGVRGGRDEHAGAEVPPSGAAGRRGPP